MRNPTALLKASKEQMVAEVDFVKTELGYRQAYVKLMAMIDDQCGQRAVLGHPTATHGKP